MSAANRMIFGDPEEFAITVELRLEPGTAPSADLARSWGAIEIWAGGRCLTRHTQGDAASNAIEWHLLDLIDWLLEKLVPLLNEEPFPELRVHDEVQDAAHWFSATLQGPSPSGHDEDAWFLARSQWADRHMLRRADQEVVLPNLFLRRFGDTVEMSWDHEAPGSARADMQFVARRGVTYVDARHVADVIFRMLEDVLGALARGPGDSFAHRLEALHRCRPERSDWHWLVPDRTARCIRAELPDLAMRLDAVMAERDHAFVLPHTSETRLLRHVPLADGKRIRALLRLLPTHDAAGVDGALRALQQPRAPDPMRPWLDGNDYAEAVRDALGWGSEPLPALDAWMRERGILLPAAEAELPASVSVLAARSPRMAAVAAVNPQSRRIGREIGLAAALGHLLLDVDPVSVEGTFEHWPAAARARAFAVALMLPEGGVRDVIGRRGLVDASGVRSLMGRFRTSPLATVRRIRNLGLIGREESEELLAEVA